MRNRVNRLVILFAGLVLVVTGTGFAVAVGSRPSPAEATPWLDEPVSRPTGSLDTKPEPRPVAMPCQRRDLEALWPEGGGTFTDAVEGNDSTAFAVIVRNVGSAQCTLAGHPKTQGLDREGRSLGLPAENGTYLPITATRPRVATIEPGESAQFFLSVASRGCQGPRHTYRGVRVELDNGMRMTLRNAWLSGVCPLRVSAWEPVTSDAGPYWALEARAMAPSSAEPGTDLEYVVELINITRAIVPLQPCMIYTQLLTPAGSWDPDDIDEIETVALDTRRLNCAPGSIGPRATVRFQMRLAIPKDFPPGKTILHWMAEGSPRPFATTELTVNPPA